MVGGAPAALTYVDDHREFAMQVGVAPDPFVNGPFLIADLKHPDEVVVYASRGFGTVGAGWASVYETGVLPSDAERVRDMAAARVAGFATVRRRAGGEQLYLAPLGDTARYLVVCRCDVTADAQLEIPAFQKCASQVRIRGGKAASVAEHVPNAGVLHVATDAVTADVFLKTRTAQLDPRVAGYFEGKRRKFEFQIQFQLARDTAADRVYLNHFLERPMNLGFAARGFVKVITALLKTLARSALCYFGDDTPGVPGRAGIAIPLVHAAEGIVITPPEAAPPGLGVDLAHTASCPPPVQKLKDLKAAVAAEGYKAGWTYTIAFHSMYLDLEEWTVCNVPGLRSVALQNFWGTQSLHVGLTVLPDGAVPKQLPSQGVDLFDVDIVHASLPHFDKAPRGP